MSWDWNVEKSVVDHGNGLWQIDLGFQGRREIISAWLLEQREGFSLIETGPTSSLENLRAALGTLELQIGDIQNILLTHIHLDHAGAAGPMALENPDVQVYVHPFGAPHLIDPSKLISSATRIYQDQMDTLWGAILPIPEQQVVVFEDGGVLPLGGRNLEVMFTPGHAWHHVALYEEATGDMFTGDVGGIRMPGESFISMPTPPPDLDPAAWRTSISAMQQRRPKRLGLAHFGLYDNADAQLAVLEANLSTVMAIGEASFVAGEEQTALTDRIHRSLKESLGNGDPEILANYELANPSYMGAMGLTRYWKKRSEQHDSGS